MGRFFLPILKLLLVGFLACFFFVGLYFLFKQTGWLGKFSNVQELKTIILSAGFFSYSVFVTLQFLQVTFIPLPASVTTIVGVILFGPWVSFTLSLLAILLGSLFAYFLGRTFGVKILIWAIGKESTKEMQKLSKKGYLAFFLMMLFPLFPDDVLCLVAGVTGMDFKFFLVTNLITRTIGIFCLCFLGNLGFNLFF